MSEMLRVRSTHKGELRAMLAENLAPEIMKTPRQHALIDWKGTRSSDGALTKTAICHSAG